MKLLLGFQFLSIEQKKWTWIFAPFHCGHVIVSWHVSCVVLIHATSPHFWLANLFCVRTLKCHVTLCFLRTALSWQNLVMFRKLPNTVHRLICCFLTDIRWVEWYHLVSIDESWRYCACQQYKSCLHSRHYLWISIETYCLWILILIFHLQNEKYWEKNDCDISLLLSWKRLLIAVLHHKNAFSKVTTKLNLHAYPDLGQHCVWTCFQLLINTNL